jgi:hypothetical protein
MDPELLQMDYTAAVCLGHFTDDELRQLENELELSQVIQRGLLPQQVPTIEGVNIAAFSRPAQILGGDYFDFIDFKNDTHGLVIADVSGHGVSAGMFMSSLQTAFHTLVPDATSPLEVLERIDVELNRSLDVTKVAEISLHWAMENSGATAGLIGMVSGETPMLNVIYKLGYADEDLPEGMETGLTAQQMADLLEFISTTSQ